MPKPKLSVVITAWNEAKNLPVAVASVKELADEIIVIDTESTDDTADIAKKLGCRVFSHPNTQIVEPVRNFSIEKATGDWILLLDADEEVSSSLAEEIQKIIFENQIDYCRIPRQNIIFGQWIKSDHWWPDYVYRLFKKGAITWESTIHSIPKTRGQGKDLDISAKTSLIHHNYQSISQFIIRLDRYTSIQAQEIIKSQTKFNWANFISKPSNEFLNQYFARQGYKQGIHGLVLSLLQAFSEFIVYAKVWEKFSFPEEKIKSNTLNQLVEKATNDTKWWISETEIQQESNAVNKILLKIKRKL